MFTQHHFHVVVHLTMDGIILGDIETVLLLINIWRCLQGTAGASLPDPIHGSPLFCRVLLFPIVLLYPISKTIMITAVPLPLWFNWGGNRKFADVIISIDDSDQGIDAIAEIRIGNCWISWRCQRWFKQECTCQSQRFKMVVLWIDNVKAETGENCWLVDNNLYCRMNFHWRMQWKN